MRLINADELCEGRVCNDPTRIAALCAPTVDAVEVVRCRDCIHFEEYETFACCGSDYIGLVGDVNPDDYCSRGERREG